MPIAYPPSLIQIMASGTGVAPVCLVDVMTLDGSCFYWATAAIVAPPKLVVDGTAPATVAYLPWVLNIDKFHSFRTMQADIGNIDVQNVSGNTVVRDIAAIITQRAFEGALFVLREWYPEVEFAALEYHGRLSVDSVSETEANFACTQLYNPSNYETPEYTYSETCQWRYASAQCGADGTNPCQNTFTTCRVPERFFGVLNRFTKNLNESIADVSLRQVVNQRLF